MAAAKITLIGFYNYMDSIGDDLFGELQTPTGIDKDEVINNILMRGGEYEVLYSEPFFYKDMIGVWSKKWQHTMEKWINALSIDYNPLENYDRMEDWTDDASKLSSMQTNENSTNSSNAVGLNTSNSSNSHNDSESTTKNENALANDYSASSGSGTTENQRSAFDAGTYQPHDKAITSTSGENVSTGLTSANGETTTTAGGSASDTKTDMMQNQLSGNENKNSFENAIDNSTSKHAGRMHGNIGVTTSQQMLQSELDIAKWNLYDNIADLFISELLIYVD